MARTYHPLGTRPDGERGVEFNNPLYDKWAKLECSVLREQLYRQFGAVPTGLTLQMMPVAIPGISVRVLAAYYNDDSEEQSEFLFNKLVPNFPTRWDDASISSLIIAGYPFVCEFRRDEDYHHQPLAA